MCLIVLKLTILLQYCGSGFSLLLSNHPRDCDDMERSGPSVPFEDCSPLSAAENGVGAAWARREVLEAILLDSVD
jgi:hypothetical protein